MAYFGVPEMISRTDLHLAPRALSVINSGLVPAIRGFGPALRVTVDGQRSSLRIGDLLDVRTGGVRAARDILGQRSRQASRTIDHLPLSNNVHEMFEAFRPAKTTRGMNTVVVHPVCEDHKVVYDVLSFYQRVNGNSSRVVVLNVDSHLDKGGYGNFFHDYRGKLNEGSWAAFVENEGLGRVIHLKSRFNEAHSSVSDKDWNVAKTRDSIADDILKEQKKYGKKLELWLTVDYDFFSLQGLNEMDVYDDVILPRIEDKFHSTPAQVRSGLNDLSLFIYTLRRRGIPLTQVVPVSSPEFLACKPDDAKSNYIKMITGALIKAF